MGKSSATAWALETAPPSMISVHRRSPSSSPRKLDTIVEESALTHLEAELTSSLTGLSLSLDGNSQSLTSYQRHGHSSYIICAQ